MDVHQISRMTADISITVHLGQTYAAAGMDVVRYVLLVDRTIKSVGSNCKENDISQRTSLITFLHLVNAVCHIIYLQSDTLFAYCK